MGIGWTFGSWPAEGKSPRELARLPTSFHLYEIEGVSQSVNPTETYFKPTKEVLNKDAWYIDCANAILERYNVVRGFYPKSGEIEFKTRYRGCSEGWRDLYNITANKLYISDKLYFADEITSKLYSDIIPIWARGESPISNYLATFFSASSRWRFLSNQTQREFDKGFYHNGVTYNLWDALRKALEYLRYVPWTPAFYNIHSGQYKKNLFTKLDVKCLEFNKTMADGGYLYANGVNPCYTGGGVRPDSSKHQIYWGTDVFQLTDTPKRVYIENANGAYTHEDQSYCSAGWRQTLLVLKIDTDRSGINISPDACSPSEKSTSIRLSIFGPQKVEQWTQRLIKTEAPFAAGNASDFSASLSGSLRSGTNPLWGSGSYQDAAEFYVGYVFDITTVYS